MSTKDKLIERFKKLPKDFTFEELVTLFASFGYTMDSKGPTSGSRVVFKKGEDRIQLHKPHPGKHLKVGCMKGLKKLMKQRKLL